MSLARFARLCRSSEIRSTAASTAELSNSTIRTSRTLPTINALPAPPTSSTRATGISTMASSTSWRNASSCRNADMNPCTEYPMAFHTRRKPVWPLNGLSSITFSFPSGRSAGGNLSRPCAPTGGGARPAGKGSGPRLGCEQREQPEQLLLRAVVRLRERPARVRAIGVHLPGLGGVREIDLQPLADDARLELLVQDREAQLDAAEKVAVHPVGAG